MTDFFDGPMLGLDTETTGVDSFEDRIVTLSMVYSPAPNAESITLSYLINPGVEIPQGAADVHGISTEHAIAHGQSPRDALVDIAGRLYPMVTQGVPLVVYNAPFDLTLLYSEFSRHQINFPYSFDKVIDPLVLDKALDKYRRGSRKLADTAKHYGYGEFGAHDATEDILATLHIARAMKSKFKSGMTLELLQEFQKDAKKEQSESFQAYLRKNKDPEAVISSAWPYEVRTESVH